MDGAAKRAAVLDYLRSTPNAGARRASRPRAQRQALEPSEEKFHRTVAQLLDWLLKEPACYSTFPSGGYILGKTAAGRMKARGLKAGMPDILVFYDHRVIGIELKKAHGRLSDAQQVMFPKLQAAGMKIVVCRNVNDVIASLKLAGVPLRNESVKVDDGWRVTEEHP